MTGPVSAPRPPAVILAGGEGRRIGGNKPFAALAGRPLVTHVAERLAPQCAALAVNASDAAGYHAMGLPVLQDRAPGMGPLAGILAALDWAVVSGRDKVLTVAVDTPFLPADLAARLAGPAAAAAYAETSTGAHPTTGLWSVALRDDLAAAIEGGLRRVRDWTDRIGAVPVHFAEEEAFFNVNTPEDLAHAEGILRGRSRGFATVLVVDWSARSAMSPAKRTKDAIYIGRARAGQVDDRYCRSRAEAQAELTTLFEEELRAGRRVLAGFDFPFGYPDGFAKAVIGSDDPLELWSALADRIQDDECNANNRFRVAADLNRVVAGTGPFWGHPQALQIDGLPFRKPDYAGFPFAERREIEGLLPRAKSCFQLMGAGSVGSQALLGIPRLQALRTRFGDALSVAPFEAADRPIVLAELYPGLIDAAVKARVGPDDILDAVQVRLLAKAFARQNSESLQSMVAEGNRREGWILGHGYEAALIAALDQDH